MSRKKKGVRIYLGDTERFFEGVSKKQIIPGAIERDFTSHLVFDFVNRGQKRNSALTIPATIVPFLLFPLGAMTHWMSGVMAK